MDGMTHELLTGRIYTTNDLREAGFRSIGENVQIHASSNIFGIKNISIGNNVRIDAFSNIVAHEPVNIGSFVHIASYCHLSGGAGIDMEDFSGLSQGVKIYSGSDDYSGRYLTNPTVPKTYTGTITGKVTLGRHVIIGSGSVILPGVTIGEGTAVGALSLVRRDLEPWSVYVGTPARRAGARKKDLLELERQLWAELGQEAP